MKETAITPARLLWPRPKWALRLRIVATGLATALILAACSEPTRLHKDVFAGDTPVLGAFVPSGVWNDLRPLKALETRVGGSFALAHWYTSWDLPYDPVPVNNLLAHGRIPFVTWQAHRQSLPDIISGRYDSYIKTWAHGVRDAAGVVYVRIFPEMNGDWAPWNGDPEAMKAAWKHVVDLFRAEGVRNVKWVFTPNVTDEPRVPENAMELYYPGADYVDVIGLDGYNWGTTRPNIGWRTYEEVFEAGYDRITSLGDQPVWLAEVASAELGGDKGGWVDDMLTSTAFPRIKAIVWFNEDKETDWRMESSAGSLDAFRKHFEVLAEAEQALEEAGLKAAQVGGTLATSSVRAGAGGTGRYIERK